MFRRSLSSLFVAVFVLSGLAAASLDGSAGVSMECFHVHEELWYENAPKLLCKTDLDQYYDRPIGALRMWGPPTGSREQRVVKNCREWNHATKQGFVVEDRPEYSTLERYQFVCETLDRLKTAKQPRVSYLDNELLAKLGSLPAIITPTDVGDDWERVLDDSNAGVTIQDYLESELSIKRSSPTYLSLKFQDGGGGFLVRATLRGDFNGDGVEDALVFISGSAPLLLTKRKPNFTMYELFHPAYVCKYTDEIYGCSESKR